MERERDLGAEPRPRRDRHEAIRGVAQARSGNGWGRRGKYRGRGCCRQELSRNLAAREDHAWLHGAERALLWRHRGATDRDRRASPPGSPVVTLADLDHVWLRAYVSETDLGKIRWGQGA